MSNQAPEKGPYKHFERPSTSRSQMHSRHFHDENRTQVSKEKKNKNMTSLWSGLIIIAIILIAGFPLLVSQFGQHSNKNLAEKEEPRSAKVQTSKKKSKVSKKKVEKKKSTKSSQSKSKPALKTAPQRRTVQTQNNTQANQQSTNQNTTNQTNSYSDQSNYQNNYSSQNDQSSQTSQRYESGKSSYTVKSGDTLSSIAQANNMSLDQLRQLNGINGDSLSSGQVLKLK